MKVAWKVSPPSLFLEAENEADCIALIEIVRDEGQRRGWTEAVEQINYMLADREEER